MGNGVVLACILQHTTEYVMCITLPTIIYYFCFYEPLEKVTTRLMYALRILDAQTISTIHNRAEYLRYMPLLQTDIH